MGKSASHMTHPKNWPIDPWPTDPLFTLMTLCRPTWSVTDRVLVNVTPRILVFIHHTVISSHDQSQLYDELTGSSSGIITDTMIAIAINFAPLSKAKFCSLAVLEPRVGHTLNVLSPFISLFCYSDWLFHGKSCPRLDVVHPGRAWSSSPACTWRSSLHYLFLQATPLIPYDLMV